jgi:tetratricopeptide (TPR) repeat protein
VLITVVGAFALLAGGTTAYMGLRFFGIGPAASLITGGDIEENAVLVLADFVGVGEAAALARAVQEGVRAEFQQSRVVTLAGPGDLRPILALMEKPPDAPLDPATAREVAQRGGMPAVIEAEVIGTGEGYIFTASIVSPESGELLASRQVPTSADPDDIMAAIGRLSRGLREEIGESYRDLDQSKPLPEVTTHSLEALQKYADSFRAEDYSVTLSLLEEAVTLDSTFAMAWRRLNAVLHALDREPPRRKRALGKAYDHREKLPDRERFIVEAHYHRDILGDPQRAVEVLETLLATFPDDRGFNDLIARELLAFAYRAIRPPLSQADLAEETFLDALERHRDRPESCGVASNLSELYVDLGRLDEAYATMMDYCRDYLENPRALYRMGHLAFQRGDYVASQDYFERVRDSSADLSDSVEEVNIRAWGLRSLMALSALQGRVAESEGFAREVMAVLRDATLGVEHWVVPVDLATLHLWVRQDTISALEVLGESVSPYLTGALDPNVDPRFFQWIAELYVDAGRVEEAREVLSLLEAMDDPGFDTNPEESPHLRILFPFAEGRYDEVLALIRASDPGSTRLISSVYLARAYEALGQADSALASYERYVTTPAEGRLFMWDQFFLGPALERGAQLFDQRGDTEKAAEYYSRFVELWSGADPELQPRVEAARRRLEEFGGG